MTEIGRRVRARLPGNIEVLRQQARNELFQIQRMELRIRELEKMLGKKQAGTAPQPKTAGRRKRSGTRQR